MSSGLELKPTTEPPEIEWSDDESAVDAMVEWFHANFEDPAMETPYESAEGGYIYIWGGPYDAQEELWDAFPDAPDDLIGRAVEEVQSGGLFDWAPAGSRIQPDDLPEDDPLSLNDRLNALGDQLNRIEEHISYWRNRDPAIGHNNPPAEFRLAPDDADLLAAEESVEEIRAELAKPNREETADKEVVERAEGAFRRLAKKIFGWIAAGAGALGLGFIGGIGKKMGEEFAADPEKFWSALDTAASTLADWAANLAHII